MDARLSALESLAVALGEEEAVLARLLRLTDAMRDALIAADFDRLDEASNAMQAAAAEIVRLGRERDGLLAAIGGAGATLSEVLSVAASLGITALDSRRQRLVSAALSLQQAQERNARLVLGAVRLRERWFNMLAGMVSPTYGAGGRQNPAPGRRFVSKSA